MSFHVPERYRLRQGQWRTDESAGNNGIFMLPGVAPSSVSLQAIASSGEGWEHVSLKPRTHDRCPYWREMVYVKDLFWDEEDCVIQYHPPKSDYVNCHPFVLHLWRPIGIELPRPPKSMVG